MNKRTTLLPRKVNESLQGRILQKLIVEVSTIPSLACYVLQDKRSVRLEVIALHHIGVIEPTANRHPRRSVYSDWTVWSISEHGMHHSTTQPGCTACYVRKRMIRLTRGLF